MLKKVISLILGCILSLFCVTLFGCNNESAEEYGQVWSALSTEKYMQSYSEDSEMLQKSKMGKTQAKLDFVGIKNETQSSQLMITAKKDIKGFDLKVADLTTANGVTFSKDNIKVYAERYIDIYAPFVNKASYGPQYFADAGYYPDALVPLNAFQKTREDRIKAGNNQGLWIDVEIPADAVAGEYSGVFELTLADSKKDIPVTLKIYDLTMPEEVHSSTNFNIWYTELGGGEGENYDENTGLTYYNYLLSKRLCSGSLPSAMTSNFETFVNSLAELTLNPRVTSIKVPARFFNFNIEKFVPQLSGTYTEAEQLAEREKFKNSAKSMLKTILDKTIELRTSGEEKYQDIDLFKKIYIGLEDEPTKGFRTERVRKISEYLTKAKLELLQDTTLQTIFNANPDLKASIAGVAQICASNYLEVEVDKKGIKVTEDENGTPQYVYYDNNTPSDTTDDIRVGGDGIMFWCPEGYQWKTESFRNEVKRKQAFGERFWWYTCVCNSPVMTYYIESIPMSMRMYSWMQYEYGIEGFLYWDCVNWSGFAGGDPYEDLLKNGWGGGEGVLLYPGAKYGLKTPISSIRLEQLRAGQQDYEYLYMLNEYLEKNNIEVTAQEIVAKIGANFYYDGAYTKEDCSETDFENYRIQILDILDCFAKGSKQNALSKINSILN